MNGIVSVRGDHVWFWCPGCEDLHAIVTPTWQFNGDTERPTILPSILVHPTTRPSPRCHSFVTDGRIQFLDDSEHALAGKTVDLPYIPVGTFEGWAER